MSIFRFLLKWCVPVVIRVECTSHDIVLVYVNVTFYVYHGFICLLVLINMTRCSYLCLLGVAVSVLCNPEPPLNAVRELLDSYWSPMVTNLRNSTHLYPRNVPFGLNFDPGIVAFCLVNLESRKCLASLKPPTASSRTTLSAGEFIHKI